MGDERDLARAEEKARRDLETEYPEPAWGDLAAELLKLDPVELAYEIEQGLGRRGENPATAVVMRAFYDVLTTTAEPRSPGTHERRARLVTGIERFRGGPAPRAGVLRSLREIEPNLAAVDDERIWSAWQNALAYENKPLWIAARLSLDLDMFGDGSRILPDKETYTDALKTAATAFNSALRRHRSR